MHARQLPIAEEPTETDRTSSFEFRFTVLSLPMAEDNPTSVLSQVCIKSLEEEEP